VKKRSRLESSSNTITNLFKSSRRVVKDSQKAKIFIELVLLMTVFARLPFSFVDNPSFRALVWYLDPSVPVPSRRDITSVKLPQMVSVDRL